MKQLIVALLLCAGSCCGSQTGTYVVDSSGVVTVDRDMRQDDLKIDVEIDHFSSKGMFDSLKRWCE